MTLPIPTELAQQLAALSSTQLAWLSGYAWAQSQEGASGHPAVSAIETARQVTVLSASQTGNARQVAADLRVQLQQAGVSARLVAAADFKSKALADEDIVLLVTSTQGDGEPPEEAVPLWRFLQGKKAPDLSRLSFAVLGLGDSSYPYFCQAGKDVDAQLAALGAQRLLARGDCDVDYQAAAAQWQQAAVAAVVALAGSAHGGTSAAITVASVEQTPASVYHKTQPFTATVNLCQKITAQGAGKDVRHLEIDLAGSGIRYLPGDALGVYHHNSDAVVAEILHHSQVDAAAEVRLHNGQNCTIQAALREHLDITQNTPALVAAYAALADNVEVAALAADKAALADYLAATPPVGVLAAYPQPLAAQALHDLFRPLSPRLYSIASAQDEAGDEVHITVGVLSYQHHGRQYCGGASGFLAAAQADSAVRVFVEPNPNFRLPENGDTPIIMIGAGTGIAPFRAFMQQREADEAAGDNWLLFGNHKFTDDFLYQAEWLQYRKNGLLTRADLAWSRQGEQKVYVQHKVQQNAALLWAWLQRGAHLYVCGNAAGMARDVEAALLDVIAGEGQLSLDDAREYLDELREHKRYQRDVY